MFLKTPFLIALLATFTVASASLQGSIIKIPPVAQQDLCYAALPCSEQQKEYILELITAMAVEDSFELFKNRKHLEFIGTQISSVHPLKFLGTIFSDPSNKTLMASVLNKYVPKNKLLGGLIPNLDREADKGVLNKHIADFAQEVHVSPEILQPYFEGRLWEEMVKFLIQS